MENLKCPVKSWLEGNEKCAFNPGVREDLSNSTK